MSSRFTTVSSRRPFRAMQSATSSAERSTSTTAISVRHFRAATFSIWASDTTIENFPEGGQPFEQVLFYYTPGDLQRILMHLNITYGLNISNEHSCENCRNRSHVTMPAWNSLRNFFINTNNYLRDEDFRHDETAENIKMTELIYLIASHEDCCIKSKLLSNVDAAKENFEQTVYDHIFKDISIEELSKLTNRSLTSFKGVPPPLPDAAPQVVHPPAADALAPAADLDLEIHLRNRQRMHVPQHIAFHQTLQKEYQMTPATYRHKHLTSLVPEPALNETAEAAEMREAL